MGLKKETLNLWLPWIVMTFTLVITGCSSSFINPYRRILSRGKIPEGLRSGSDNGEPLMLTPFLEAGKIKEAQTASRVNHSRIVGFESYSGFFTVDKHFNSSMFFWYFPVENVSIAATAPVLLWLQGGPGATSLFGLFEENGPFYVAKNLKALPREYSWHKTHHLLYIDNPVGTGFSCTDNGYSQNETHVGDNLYKALTQFFQLFPDLQKNHFYASGESYAGKYVPAVGYTIHKNNPTAKIQINLKGLAIGNGYSDPLNQLNYGDYLYQLGLIDTNAKERFDKDESAAIECVKQNDYACAFKIMDDLMDGDENHSSFFRNISGFDTYYNYLHTAEDPKDELYLLGFLGLPETRKAIHVGDLPFHDLDSENKVAKYLEHDILDTVAPWITELLSHYRMLIYNGQLDIICAYPMMVNYLQNLPFDGAKEYKTEQRYKFYVDGEIAGYYKLAKNLLEVLIRDAGHMVPRDQAKWAYVMMNAFTSGNSLSHIS
ncbi:vitellogenic carboxypeptidase-like [Malaya genurostris]|uniref:vitellogenic carboxypeptidase-like n=1 Tax=Malaya genurostris TaxID=325434 RepID=UPI0026F3D326|nr:vitellogenic carboxypeptidase-like [Malaya genurostris]